MGGDAEGQHGAADATGGEGDAGEISGNGEEDEAAAAAPAAGVGAAKTGLGESMATFFQRGATVRFVRLDSLHAVTNPPPLGQIHQPSGRYSGLHVDHSLSMDSLSIIASEHDRIS